VDRTVLLGWELKTAMEDVEDVVWKCMKGEFGTLKEASGFGWQLETASGR